MRESADLVRKSSIYSVVILTVLVGIDFAIDVMAQDIHYSHYLRLAFLDFSMLLAWIFSKRKFFDIARFIWLFCVYLAFLFYPVTGLTPNIAEDLFLILFIFIVITSMVLVLHDLRKEKMLIVIWFTVITSTFLYCFYYILDSIHLDRYQAIRKTFDAHPILFYGYLGACIFLLIIIISVKGTNQRRLQSLKLRGQQLIAQKEITQQQQKALQNKQSDLIKMKNRLSSTNEYLEKRVSERKNELGEARSKLVRFGFFNEELNVSIYQLANMVEQEGKFNDEYGFKKLNSKVEDLDKQIRKINDTLSELGSEV